jgi:hypothetical protein
MNKGSLWSLVFGFILMMALLAACATPAATPTINPTAVPLAIAITPTLPLAVAPLPTPAPTPSPEPPTPTPEPTPPPPGILLIQDGHIQFWHEERQQTELLWAIGDAHDVWSTPDGQTALFFRRWVDFEANPRFGCQHAALWAIDRDGQNPRELVSFDTLRGYLDEQPCANRPILIHQLSWLPETNRLIFSLIREDSHLPPQAIVLLDVETGRSQLLAPATSHFHFVPSPDGQQLALISYTGLSFVTTDGRDWREDVLTYPSVGLPTPIFPRGLWTQAGDAFVLVTAEETESPFIFDVTIWHLPLDGGETQQLAYLTNTYPESVTFAPDGRRLAYYAAATQSWPTIPLSPEPGALAVARQLSPFPANRHWSPAGEAYHFPNGFQGIFARICEDEEPAEGCDAALDLGDDWIIYLEWLDDGRFLYLTGSPRALYLGSFSAGTVTPVTVWREEEEAGVTHFAARPLTALTGGE